MNFSIILLILHETDLWLAESFHLSFFWVHPDERMCFHGEK